MAKLTSVPPVKFAQARGARIAYQEFGEGPPTMVAIPPAAQNIEMSWEWPPVRAMLERFGSFCRYIHFDKRGTGASDRDAGVNAIDERVEDLRAVMDAAEVDRAHLLVVSEGGPMGILFAATYPERVDSLVLIGSGPSLVPPDMTEEEKAGFRERNDRYASVWGTNDSPVVDGFAPSLAGDTEYRAWHQRYERAAAGQDSIRDLLELALTMDVRELLPTLDVPTLVIHRTGDRIVPVAWGKELAETIPGARLFLQESEDHFPYVGDMEGWMVEVERFVTGTVQPRPAAAPHSRDVHITTLGGFEVTVGGEKVSTSAWGSRLARQLLKRLVAARGRPVTRDELFEMLWPDEFDRSKLGPRLSVQLSAVRRVLGTGVVADRETVRLDLDEIVTDLEAFFVADDDAAIVGAYGGEFLPEDRFDDWTIAMRDETRSRFVTAARTLTGRHLAGGSYRIAVRTARRLIEIDRYDEAAYRDLVRALAAMGEDGEAQRAHDAWAEAMGELGIAVEPYDMIIP